MTPFQIALLVELALALALCWFKGGHTERLAAAWVLVIVVIDDGILPEISFHGFRPLDTLMSLTMAGVFLWIAMTRDRWWPFLAAGSTLLVLVVQLYVLLVGGIDLRAYISAHVGLMALLLLTMLIGVLERRVAGERAVFETTSGWRRSPRDEPDAPRSRGARHKPT
jgi:hypothetical protein